MRKMLEGQKASKADKYVEIIRESAEIRLEEGQDEEICFEEESIDEPENYYDLKNEVLQILKRKVDEKMYKKTSKKCHKK